MKVFTEDISRINTRIWVSRDDVKIFPTNSICQHHSYRVVMKKFVTWSSIICHLLLSWTRFLISSLISLWWLVCVNSDVVHWTSLALCLRFTKQTKLWCPVSGPRHPGNSCSRKCCPEVGLCSATVGTQDLAQVGSVHRCSFFSLLSVLWLGSSFSLTPSFHSLVTL